MNSNTDIKAIVLSTLINGPQLLYEREVDENIFDDTQSKRLYRLINKTFKQGVKDFDENFKINLSEEAKKDKNEKFINYVTTYVIHIVPESNSIDKYLDYLNNRYNFLSTANELSKADFQSADYLEVMYRCIEKSKKFTRNDWVLDSVESIPEGEIDWVIPNVIPVGISVFAGDGGVGKSSFYLKLLADLSNGNPTMFESEQEYRDPVNVVYLSREDSTTKVLKQKLVKMKANMKRISTLDVDNEKLDKVKLGNLSLERIVIENNPRVVVLDPIQAFLPPKVDMNSCNDMRNITQPLVRICERYKVAVIFISHTNKQTNTSGRGRVRGSADIWDISRCAFLFGHADEKGLRYCSNEKNNYAKQADTVLFSMNDDGIPQFESMTDKKDRHYQGTNILASANDGSKTVSSKEMAQAKILEYINLHGSMTKDDMMTLDDHIALATFNRALQTLLKNNLIYSEYQSLGSSKGRYAIYKKVELQA